MNVWPQDFDPVRATYEPRLLATLGQINGRQQKRISASVKMFGSAEQVPPSIWEAIRHDIEENLFLILLAAAAAAVGVVAISLHARAMARYREEIATERARRQAIRTARQLAESYQRQIQTASLPPSPTTGTRVVVLGGDPVVSSPLPDALPGLEIETFDARRRRQLEEIERIFRERSIRGPSGISPDEYLAGDAVNEAVSNGARAAGESYGAANPGQKVELIWRVRKIGGRATGTPDEKVCPICLPLDGTPDEFWSAFAPDGPGTAHIHCRCETQVFVHADVVPGRGGIDASAYRPPNPRSGPPGAPDVER